MQDFLEITLTIIIITEFHICVNMNTMLAYHTRKILMSKLKIVQVSGTIWRIRIIMLTEYSDGQYKIQALNY